MRRPVFCSPRYGDGVWRLRWHPALPETLLVAGMRSGLHVVDVARLRQLTLTLNLTLTLTLPLIQYLCR